MTATTPCYRHSRRAWMAACPECTAWNLAASLAQRDGFGAVPAAECSAARPAGLHLAA